jgi:SAM-dependent methyltransferase
MKLWDAIDSVGPVRKALWRAWYSFLTRKLRDEDILFLNYAFETDPALAVPLAATDERDRTCLQLYHHVASQTELTGKHVLEVSCGHGGGASYLTSTFRPARYVGLDLNAAGIRFCRARHSAVPALEFACGDACALPFADESFDVVVNVEASHCYPDFARFLSEVARVLRPGGRFVYADFRFGDSNEVAAWAKTLESSPLQCLAWREINDEVRRGMELNTPRSLALIDRHLPRFLHGAGRDFAGVRGSRVYSALTAGTLSYRSYCFAKN